MVRSVRESSSRLPSRRGHRRTRQVDDQDRAVVLRVATRLLEREGTGALSVRRIAKEVGTSYQLVYTLFGGKQGLLDALFRHGFESLESACREIRISASPAADLVKLALAYRHFAHAHRELYALMFGRNTPGFEPDAGSRRVAMESFGVLSEAASRAYEASSGARRHFRSAEALARAAWSATHGHVALELGSWFGPEKESARRLEETMRALVDGDASEGAA